MLPKADLHVHLEGTITPDMVRTLAARNGIPMPDGLMNAAQNGYLWDMTGGARQSLLAFVNAYDRACMVMKTGDDYTSITQDYLDRAAAEGCIYVEFFISADHGAALGLSFGDMVRAIARGIDQARDKNGIEARLISTCVRHYGPEKCLAAGKATAAHPHPLVTGFGMAGDENAGAVADFLPAYVASGLQNRTAHAGEAAGPDSVRAARDLLGIRRFGHMVRALEDDELMEELIALRAVPEVCVSSNMALKVYRTYGEHPLRIFFDRGLKVTLGSDDPSFFHTSIGREYKIARDHFGFTDTELRQLTVNALQEAFVDEKTRQELLSKVV